MLIYVLASPFSSQVKGNNIDLSKSSKFNNFYLPIFCFYWGNGIQMFSI